MLKFYEVELKDNEGIELAKSESERKSMDYIAVNVVVSELYNSFSGLISDELENNNVRVDNLGNWGTYYWHSFEYMRIYINGSSYILDTIHISPDNEIIVSAFKINDKYDFYNDDEIAVSEECGEYEEIFFMVKY